MPKITSANTNAAALMIGEHGARLMLGEVARTLSAEDEPCVTTVP